ncbi:hypothetical protein FNV43_RR00440 [Rhamnella rubrinervis]|uniref:Uncharacterized protein n=1 Tax=Rhamnella rubrinervis TaxID=2594499 RepID=A0A8K0MS07_9ROSA|nr:hypothetical protein FNV43_RR00440 [Rhamnella rubrinervis]
MWDLGCYNPPRSTEQHPYGTHMHLSGWSVLGRYLRPMWDLKCYNHVGLKVLLRPKPRLIIGGRLLLLLPDLPSRSGEGNLITKDEEIPAVYKEDGRDRPTWTMWRGQIPMMWAEPNDKAHSMCSLGPMNVKRKPNPPFVNEEKRPKYPYELDNLLILLG